MAPTRTCVGCRTARSADHLIRVVRLGDGELAVDRHAPGRGAWLCAGSADCLAEAVRRHGFERAFRASMEVGAVERLCARLETAWEH